MKRLVINVLVVALATTSLSCSSMSNTKKGAIGGAAAGGAIGGIIGHQSGNTAVGAIIGAAVGGAAGAYIGNYMDKQAAEMEKDLEGARIERVGEGIKITFDSGILFDVNKAALKPASKTNLTDLARILNKYPTPTSWSRVTPTPPAVKSGTSSSRARARAPWSTTSPATKFWRRVLPPWATANRSPSRPTTRRKAGRPTVAWKWPSTPTTNSRRLLRTRPAASHHR